MSTAWLSELYLQVVNDSSYSKRLYRTAAPLGFLDKDGHEYWVPEGTLTDLASIPQPALGFIGTLGDRAAVLHDYLCRQGQVARQKADRVFHSALLASGVDSNTAWLMWAAVAGATAGLEGPDEDERYIA